MKIFPFATAGLAANNEVGFAHDLTDKTGVRFPRRKVRRKASWILFLLLATSIRYHHYVFCLPKATNIQNHAKMIGFAVV